MLPVNLDWFFEQFVFKQGYPVEMQLINKIFIRRKK